MPARDLESARSKRLRDVLAPGLDVVFCGINPGLWSAAVGHHFARPGNRFWTALHDAGFTDRLLRPDEDRTLLLYGCGLTNLVSRASAGADELTRDELARGARALARKLARHRPRCLAVLGLGAYRSAFAQPRAGLGLQDATLAGVAVWVLPNPSGRTAAYQRADFARLFRALREHVCASRARRRSAGAGRRVAGGSTG